MTHLVPLAKELDKDKVTPGVLGFIVFAALAFGVWMLMKSMNRHMGRVKFEEATEGAPSPSAKTAASVTSPSSPDTSGGTSDPSGGKKK